MSCSCILSSFAVVVLLSAVPFFSVNVAGQQQSSAIGIFGDNINHTVNLLFTMETNTWTLLPSFSESRASAIASFCPKAGAIYVVGGDEGGATALKLDVTSAPFEWTNATDMSTERVMGGGVCLSDGMSLLVCGGAGDAGILASCEVLDTSGNTWSAVASMSQVRLAFGMVLYRGNPVALGGLNTTTLFTSSEQYDSASNSWSSFPPFSQPRNGFAAAVVQGNIYLSGGQLEDGDFTLSIEMFSASSSSWTVLSSSMPSTRAYLVSISFHDQLVLIGGNDFDVDVYDPSTEAWTTLPGLPQAYLVTSSICGAAFST